MRYNRNITKDKFKGEQKMTYKDLQNQLKGYKEQGLTDVKLNASKEILQAEYDRLTVADTQEVVNTQEVEFDWSVQSEKANLVCEQLVKYVLSEDHGLLIELQYQILKLVMDSKEINLKNIDGLDSIEAHDAYMDCKYDYPNLFPTVATYVAV